MQSSLPALEKCPDGKPPGMPESHSAAEAASSTSLEPLALDEIADVPRAAALRVVESLGTALFWGLFLTPVALGIWALGNGAWSHPILVGTLALAGLRARRARHRY